jgi:hypothetical protein
MRSSTPSTTGTTPRQPACAASGRQVPHPFRARAGGGFPPPPPPPPPPHTALLLTPPPRPRRTTAQMRFRFGPRSAPFSLPLTILDIGSPLHGRRHRAQVWGSHRGAVRRGAANRSIWGSVEANSGTRRATANTMAERLPEAPTRDADGASQRHEQSTGSPHDSSTVGHRSGDRRWSTRPLFAAVPGVCLVLRLAIACRDRASPLLA